MDLEHETLLATSLLRRLMRLCNKKVWRQQTAELNLLSTTEPISSVSLPLCSIACCLCCRRRPEEARHVDLPVSMADFLSLSSIKWHPGSISGVMWQHYLRTKNAASLTYLQQKPSDCKKNQNTITDTTWSICMFTLCGFPPCAPASTVQRHAC